MKTVYASLVERASEKAGGKLPFVGIPRYISVARGRAADKDHFELNRIDFRDRLWEAQKGICALCDTAIRKRYYATLDHVQPRSRGGRHWIGNLLLMHKECNHQKADAAPGRALRERLEHINHLLELEHGPEIFESPVPR